LFSFFCFFVQAAKFQTITQQCGVAHNIDVHETILDSSLLSSPVWLDNEVVFALSRGGHVWRSGNGGATFTDLTGQLPNSTQSLGIRTIYKTAAGGVVLLAGNSRDLWVSKDRGVTWMWVRAPGRVYDLQPHPTHKAWLALQGYTDACFQTTDTCSLDLWFSADMGESWHTMISYVSEFSWAGAGHHGAHENQIFVVDWADKTGNIFTKPFDQKRLLRSRTLFRPGTTPQVIAVQLLDFLAIRNLLLIAQWAKGRSGLQLVTSEDFGETWHVARFPLGLEEQRYTILDVELGSIFINVEHSSANWGNVYVSDAFGSNFSLSLRHNPRQPWGPCDFTRMHGLNGIYVANQFIESTVDPENPSLTDNIHTLITYDLGGEWRRLDIPVNEPNSCDTTDTRGICGLNLHGATTNYWGRFYTRPSALGMMLGTGNVGTYLRERLDEVNTYFSRDAGWTWSLFSYGSHSYDITNHGALVLLVDNVEATNQLVFSWNEGQTWNTCNFSDPRSGSIEVEGVTSEPGALRPEFLLYGRRRVPQEVGILVHVDFTGLHERQCQGWDRPRDENGNNANSDYEFWSPSDMRGDQCLLGRRDVYVRKIASRECLNPPQYHPMNHTTVKNCSCTREDYECDYCFEPNANDECMVSSDCPNFDPKRPPADCVGVWYESRGYRRVPGDTCTVESGVDLLPIAHSCPVRPPTATPVPVSPPSPPTGTLTPGLAALLMGVMAIGILVLIFGLFYWASSRNQTVRNCLGKVLPEKYLPSFEPPVGPRYDLFNPNQPNILDEDLLQDDDTLQEDASVLDVTGQQADEHTKATPAPSAPAATQEQPEAKK
jgi:hypothetical protein